MKEFNIVMLGARGAGKSSLLTSIYTKFSEVAEGTGLVIDAELETKQRLKKRLQEMQLGLRAGKQGSKDRQGMPPDTTETAYNLLLRLGSDPEKKALRLNFYDYPGEWLEIDSKERGNIIEKIKVSHVVLLAIDTPPLMHEDEFGSYIDFHNEINKSYDITELLKELSADLQQQEKLFLFTPVKCEKWMQENSREVESLVSLIQEGYKPLLTQLKSSKAVIAVTPVQTLGNLHFSHREKAENEDLVYRFSILKRDSYGVARYEPKHIEQPLLYLLYFIFHEALKSLKSDSEKIQNGMYLKENNFEHRSILEKFIGVFTGADANHAQEIKTIEQNLNEVISFLKELKIPLTKLDSKRIKDEEKGFVVLQDKNGRL